MIGWEGWSTGNRARECNLDVQPNGQWYMTHLRYLIEWKTPNPLRPIVTRYTQFQLKKEKVSDHGFQCPMPPYSKIMRNRKPKLKTEQEYGI